MKDFHGNDQRFVYYFFRWLAPRIATMDVGSANPTLNRNHVHPIDIRWPTRVEEQRAIAHILGTLDNKIELNRRMNETLEEMARYEMTIPPKAIAEAFTERIRPTVERIIANNHESRTLAAMRDTLLPKLVSGEMRLTLKTQKRQETQT